MDEVDYKETAILGQNERTGKEQKDRKIPFPGRVGITAITRRFAATQRTGGFFLIYCQFAAKTL